MLKLKILFCTIITAISLQVYCQENIIISKVINYQEYSENIAGNKIDKLSFENTVNTEKYGELPVYLYQQVINNSIDSVSINLFKSEFIQPTIEIHSSLINNSPQISQDISFSRGQKILNIYIMPFINNGSKVEALSKFELMVTTFSSNSNKKRLGGIHNWASNSVLATGDWYKVKISKSGIYKITATDISAMGFDISNLSINDVRIYGNGGGTMPESNSAFYYDDLKEDAIKIFDINSNGKFDGSDYLIFYAQGPNIWKYNKSTNSFNHNINIYDNYSYYYITIRNGSSLRINTIPQNTSTPTQLVTDFIDFQFHDTDSLNLIKSGKQWFGEEYDILLNHNFSFNFPNIISAKPVTIRTLFAARSTSPSIMNVVTNGFTSSVQIPSVPGTYDSDYAVNAFKEMNINSTFPNISIFTNYIKSTSVSVAWLDYIEVLASRSLIMSGTQMSFRNIDATSLGNISKFTLQNASSDIQIWDITNITEPKNIEYTFAANDITFVQSTDSLREFIAFNSNYLTVTNVGKLSNQNLHSQENTDFVICYNPIFFEQANELANFHRTHDNMSVTLVEQSKLFNEFSSGAADISALRNFMKMLYDRALNNSQNPPQYLLLFGDASYDYKDRKSNNTNLILTYESPASLSPLSSFSSDDFYGLLDDNEGANCNGNLDIGIGRFPISSVEEAKVILTKIKRYTATHEISTLSDCDCPNGISNVSNLADWRNIACFIGDDQDNNIHVSQADYLANYVKSNNPVFNIDKIFLDAYVQQTTPGGQRYPDAMRDLNLRIKKGALVINYTGHGGETGLAHESLLVVSDINSWKNAYNMPLFITATCEFSRYDDPARASAGELSFLHPDGGFIGLLTTSRLTFSGSNFTLNKAIFQNIFTQTNGEFPALGDVLRNSKVTSGSINNNKNFVLLGDPALKLAYPQFQVKTLAINNIALEQFKDTLGALSELTISGQVENNGQIISNFNGFLYPTIFDKSQSLSTLGNDLDSSPFQFMLQKNILYKGKITVKNGLFHFTFIVPKDINYTIGNGRISYYAENGSIDASGYSDSLKIGGSSTNKIMDNEGPRILPFINDKNFISGGLSDEDPIFLAYIFDENGINTTGNGIGHDIILTLDDNSAESIELNSFYQSNIDSYKEGSVKYPFAGLSVGHHNLSIKVWDILNNSSTASIDFVVASSDQSIISEVFNYPNPFKEYTNFVFEHNLQCTSMEVEIKIFDVAGRLVRVLGANILDPGFRIADEELKWNGKSANGSALANGIYTYQLVIKTNNNQSSIKSGKLVYIN